MMGLKLISGNGKTKGGERWVNQKSYIRLKDF